MNTAVAATPLQVAWRAVRKDYFPRWDRERRWHIRHGNIPGTCRGKCFPEKRLIVIADYPDDPDERDWLLIHETCHVFRGCRGSKHGMTWQARMTRASRRACALGRPGLAARLDKDVANYQQAALDNPNPTLALYGLLEDWTHQEPHTPYKVVLGAVAAEHGMTVPELLESFPRCRKVYEQARDFALEHERQREGLASAVSPPPTRGDEPPAAKRKK
jgi:hypothetical protein